MEPTAAIEPGDLGTALELLGQVGNAQQIEDVLTVFPVLLTDAGVARMIEDLERAESEGDDQLSEVYRHRLGILQGIRGSLTDNGIPSEFHGGVFAAQSRVRRAEQSGDLDDLTAAANAWIELVARPDLKDMPSAFIGQVFGSTADALIKRFRTSESMEDVDYAILLWEQHTTLQGSDPGLLPTLFNNIGRAYLERYGKSVEVADLNNAVKNFNEALHRSGEEHALRVLMLQGLGESLLIRSHHTGQIEDVRVALNAFDEASPQFESGWSAFLPQLEQVAGGLLDQALRDDVQGPLDCAIEVSNRLIEHTSDTDSAYPPRLAVLARALYERAVRTVNEQELDNAITCWARVHELSGDTVSINWFDGYALALRLRYVWQASVKDLQDAITLWEHVASNAEESDEDLPRILGNLSSALRERYMALGENDDLFTAAAKAEWGLKLALNDPDSTINLLGHHSSILLDRYNRFGNPDDLDAAITDLNQALEIAGRSNNISAELFHALGLAYRYRYLRDGALGDLEQALSVYAEAIQATPQDARFRLGRYEGDLGLVLVDRYRHTRDMKDLDRAIELFDSALEHIPAHAPQRAGILSNRGMVYGNRYEHVTHSPEDLRDAIDSFQQAVEAAPERSLERLAFLNNLVNQLHDVFLKTGETEELDRALASLEEALSQAPKTLPARPIYLATFGVVRRAKYEKHHRPEDREAAIAAYREGATLGLELNAELAMGNARNWLHWAFEREAWNEVIEAYQILRQAVEHLLQAQVLRRTKEVWLLEAQGVTARAAYAFVMSGREKEAVEALEVGQARLLSETLALSRTNLESLQGTEHHELFDRFRKTVQAWDRAHRDSQDELPRLHAQLQELTQAIRAIPGHEDFLKPSGIDEIGKAAVDRVLVYIVATTAGGLVLQVESESEQVTVREHRLSQLSSQDLDAHMHGSAGVPGYLEAYRQWQQTPEDAELRQAWFGALDAVGNWLWTTGLGRIISSLTAGTHVTLIPCGGLALLPLHTAWGHDEKMDARQYLGDHAVISYAPNAKAVVVAAERLEELGVSPLPSAGLIVVHSPHNPDLPDLPGAPPEAEAVQSFFQDSLVLQGNQASREKVLNAMSGRMVTHLACHGRADLRVPLDSGLLMANGEWLTVADLLKSPPQQLRLVTLSACETAMPGTLLPEEVVGLPGGVLAAGACGVVASLWSVPDVSTMLLMTRFYEQWRTRGLPPDEALAAAQSWLREADNEEILLYVRSAVDAGRMADQAYRMLRVAIGFQSMENKPFEHPFYWGAFCYVGV